ncbi:MAG: phosphoribosylamine--glycine ligase, partial [Nitriliruptoraceae bacterium]
SGGREHALAWRLASSASVERVSTAPGSPGTATLGATHPVDVDDPASIANLAEQLQADLVVVGPEGPLVAGVVDALTEHEIPAFGPTSDGARIEGSKAFAKDVMITAGVPTAGYVTTTDRDEAHQALDRFSPPYVVKADGLAAGKGVSICDELSDARTAIDDAMVRGRFGDAGARVVIEEFLDGPERSVFAVCDGTHAVLLTPAQDYKRVGDGDIGPNTGGMGAYAPVPGFGPDDVAELGDTIFTPVLAELARRGQPYRGLLYAGLVDTTQGPKLLEFNARFGDPETQVILPLMASDLGELLDASARGSLSDVEVAWHDQAAVTVVMANRGYPTAPETGHAISGLDAVDALDGVVAFHAGTSREGGAIVASGGRVLAVTAVAESVIDARHRAYDAVGRITWDGVHHRSDIAAGVA